MRLTDAGLAGLAIASAPSASVASGLARISSRIFASPASSYARWSPRRADDPGSSVPPSRRRWTSRLTHDWLHPNCSATSIEEPHPSYARATARR